MRAQVLAVVVCAGFTLLVVLAAWVVFFRLSCRLCKLPPPSVSRTLGIVLITFVATSLAEAMLTGVVRVSYDGMNLPLWEVGFASFFLGLPVDMIINAGVHGVMMKIPFGKGVEVWFVQRAMLSAVLLAVGLFVALALFAGQGG